MMTTRETQDMIGETTTVSSAETSRGRGLERRALPRVAAALAVILCFVAAPAGATIIHREITSFNGSDAPEGPLGAFSVSLGVDESNDDIYVLESNAFEIGKGAIDKFDKAGAYAGVQITGAETPQGSFAFGLLNSGVAVDNSAGPNNGAVYVADTEHGVVDRFSSAGAYLCQITGSATPAATECNGASGSETPDGSITPTGVAVDGSGNLYVADTAHSAVDKFAPTGKFVSQIVNSHLTPAMASLAINSSGTLYVTNLESNVSVFDSSGAFVSVLNESSPTGVAVERATGHVFVGDLFQGLGEISEYEESGERLTGFAMASEEYTGLGIGPTGRINAIGPGAGVTVYGPDVVVPTTTTTPATDVQMTTAVLHGHVDPDAAHGGGEITECEFEYGTTSGYGQTAPCSPAPPYATGTDASAEVTVAQSATYHFRLKAGNANGSSVGQDEAFTTFGPAAVDSETSTARALGATLRVQVNPFGNDTSCRAEYVDDSTFQASGYSGATVLPCEPTDVGSGFGDRGASVTLSALKISTTYHYRFVVSNSAGETVGTDQTFTTFAVENFKFEINDKEGQPYTQAGGHPYKWVTHFDLSKTHTAGGELLTVANLKDVKTELPAGLIGNPSATAKCTRDQLTNFLCSGATQVGELHVTGAAGNQQDVGIYNLVPPTGVPAEFGAKLNSLLNVYIDANVRTGGDYGVTAEARNASTAIGVTSVTLELWGVPADPSHDEERACPTGAGQIESPPCASGEPRVPFLSNPSSCSGPKTVSLSVDSWQDAGSFLTATSSIPAATGCSMLDFTPSLALQPDTSAADSPSGLHFDLQVPQNENPDGLAEANLKQATVALPVGMSISPSVANGLAACSPEQIGIGNDNEQACPDASKVGSVEIDTPLLPDPLTGGVYVAQQFNNPFNSLLAIYIAAQADGALVKLAGHVVADPTTGQVTTTFDENPQLPFKELKLDLFGGPRGALATPESCGTFTTSTALEPWSATPITNLSSPFQISSGCVSGFSPSVAAGTASPQAAAYSPFALSFSRNDTDQELSGLTVSLPPGLLAKIAGIPLCSDAALAAASSNSGTAEQTRSSCPAASQLGTVQTAVGPGASPLSVAGKAYLTGAYRGAPYGLAVVVPALAGPFDFGTVVVRTGLYIDSNDAHVTAVSDPFPAIIKGVPLRLRRVDVVLDRPNFTFNPTNCNGMRIATTLTSTVGTTAAGGSGFQASGCGGLRFKPGFSVSTQGKTSKATGASLHVRVTSGTGQANIGKVRVALPKQLPSRLTTLQQACTEKVFAANPSSCPAGSLVGTAKAVTPVLASPLTGPAYLVSHGGAAFPDLEIILQAEGITVILDGNTDIKKGITTSTFNAVPDAPISSFELNLPQGSHSVLATNLPAKAHRSMCGQRLLMPTTLTGQNGAVTAQTTRVSVTGCPKAKAKTTKKKKKVKARRGSSRLH